MLTTVTSTAGVGTADAMEVRRRGVLEVAATVLAEQGPHGLTLRGVATAAGGSTQLIYTLFGGKPGLADALYAEGFARLEAALRESLRTDLAPGDPERLVRLGLAYRRFALAEPAFFSVMFGRAVPGFSPGAAAGAAAGATVELLGGAVRDCLAAGTIKGAKSKGTVTDEGRAAYELTLMCWSTVHGIAALESAGNLVVEDPDAFAEATLRIAVGALRAKPPRAKK